MKRFICLFLSLTVIICLFGCKEKEKPQEVPTIKNTIMIYMIGSDLEAKGGAGTNDLEEIKKSGIDVSQTNVIIYAGGSKRWHNDDVTYEEGNIVLKLNSDGYEKINTITKKSMGEAATLSEFLNYAHTNYPAEQFSLVLWDHGNGPLIGYGKDMLYDNDSLTLAEMKTAFENSPFKADKKLEWVGFDACLMSSAELCCVLDDYAKYLVASQEVEPAFGWNYTIFGKINGEDTKTFLTNLTKSYLETCNNYYKEKEYEPQDTTLSLIDLSKAAELEKNVNSLFSKASPDVNKNYNKLTTTRVNTRAFGRATTGSEYDLIDLYDMADQMSELYPDETQKIKSTLEGMVISNSTNTLQSCGISIYYPFYNKKYYEKSWGEVYGEIGVLNEYASYLNKYDDIWLKSDKLDGVAASKTPNTLGESKYSLELTPEQAENYANASYYILKKEGEGLYTRIFSSKKVEKSGNNIIANFDGKIIYAKNDFDEYWIPVVEEHDTIGSTTRYSAYVNLTNSNNSEVIEGEKEHSVMGHRFHLAANNDTKKIGKSALVQYDEELDAGELMSGKQEDADLSQWTQYYFLHEKHKYLKRDENGVIAAFDTWENSNYLSANVSKIGDGLEFLFDYIPDGGYYVMFEIEDTQGNKYCSELLQIETSGNSLSVDYKNEPIELSWKTGNKIKLFEKENVEVSIVIDTSKKVSKPTEKDKAYFFEVKNNNNFDVCISASNLICNGNIYCKDASLGYVTAPANSTFREKYGFDFGVASKMNMITELDSIEFYVTMSKASGEKTFIKNQCVYIELSEETSYIPKDWDFMGTYNYDDYTCPVRDILAKNQVIFNNDGLKGTLIGLGGNNNTTHMNALFCFENTSDKTQYAYIDGFSFDNVYVEKGTGAITVLPKMKVYYQISISEDDLDDYMIDSPSSAKVLVRFTKYETLKGGGGDSKYIWCPILLSQKGKGVKFVEGDKVIYNKNGVKIAIKDVIKSDIYEGGFVEVIMTINNTSGKDIAFSGTELTLNGEKINQDKLFSGAFLSRGECGNNQKSLFEINIYAENKKDFEISFKPHIVDITCEKELWNDDEALTINISTE